jgi:hypothetical protein
MSSKLASKRLNEVDVFEQDTKVAQELDQENSPDFLWYLDGAGVSSGLARLFRIRVRIAKRYIRRWDYFEQRAQENEGRRSVGYKPYEDYGHPGPNCECDPCQEGMKRLLRDVGVLPSEKGVKR